MLNTNEPLIGSSFECAGHKGDNDINNDHMLLNYIT